MANMKAGFIAGTNAKVKIFKKTMAYCSDVSYSVDVQTIPVESIGKYEAHSHEPVGYAVNGQFTIIRYTKNASDAAKGGVIKDVAAGKGNAPENIADGASTAGMHLDPARMLASQTFDLEILEKRDGDETLVYTISDCRITRRTAALNKRGILTDTYTFNAILASDSDDVTAVGNSGPVDLS